MRATLAGQAVLVTGGAGFIGSHLTDALLAQGVREVAIIDNMFLGSEYNLEEAIHRRAVLYRDDAEIASSLEYIIEKHRVDTVFNCATKALNYSFLNPSNAFDTNTRVALNLLELQRKGKFKTLCHFSSSEVYGTALYEPMDESHPRHPTTTYAAGKAAADLAVESYVRMFGLDAFIVRPFNNYGPRQNFRGPLAGVIPITIARIQQGDRPRIQGDGTQKRDFVFVRDTVEATLALHQRLAPGQSVNIAADNSIRIGDLVAIIARLMRYDGPIVREPARPSDVYCHNASSALLKSLIEPRVTPFELGLRESIAWQLETMTRDPRT
jgi:UDP-glucose 4-epimerase